MTASKGNEKQVPPPIPLAASPAHGTPFDLHWPEKFGDESKPVTADTTAGPKVSLRPVVITLPDSIPIYGPLSHDEREALVKSGVSVWAEVPQELKSRK